VPEV